MVSASEIQICAQSINETMSLIHLFFSQPTDGAASVVALPCAAKFAYFVSLTKKLREGRTFHVTVSVVVYCRVKGQITDGLSLI